jgi:hypothetical protein
VRFHRQLKDALRSRLDNQDLLSHLPWVLLGLRAAPKEDSAISSAEMVYGEPLTLTVRKMDLTLRCIQRRLQMQRSMARKFTLQPYRR